MNSCARKIFFLFSFNSFFLDYPPRDCPYEAKTTDLKQDSYFSAIVSRTWTDKTAQLIPAQLIFVLPTT